MAGTKTRFGYLGGGGDEPPDAGDPGAARTVIGRDLHLPQLPSGFAPAPTPKQAAPVARARMAMAPVVRAPIPTPMPEAVTDAIPEKREQRPPQSRLARFLGRWTTGGHFRPSQSLRTSDLSVGEMDIPRDTAARNVLLVLAVAALTFLITFAVMRWRKPHATPPVAVPAAGARMAAPPLMPTRPAPPPVAVPAPAPAPSPSAAPEAVQNPAVDATARPNRRALSGPKSGATKPTPSSQPPAHLQGELLPLGP